MQHSVRDDLTAAFCGSFYRALIAGRTVDEALSAGRIAMRAVAIETPASQDVRDWASPVLYLRSPGGRVFRPVSDSSSVGRASADLEKRTVQVVKTVAESGQLVGAIGPSEVPVHQQVENVLGYVFGAISDGGGAPPVFMDLGTVSGTAVGQVVGDVGKAVEALQRLKALSDSREKKSQSKDPRKDSPGAE
jgi:hypothetical protein